MIFSDSFFIFIFIPLFLLIFYSHQKIQKISIILFSFLFYYAFNPQVLGFFLIPFILLNFVFYRFNIEKASIIIFNLFFLIFFKYQTIFFDLSPGKLFLFGSYTAPMGISFITFQLISFIVDNKKSDSKISVLDFFNYFTFFPQMIAGPICRKADLLHQITSIGKSYNFSSSNFLKGSLIFTIGAIKKVVIADNIAKYIDPFFSNPASSNISAWVSTLGYYLQIYFDFSAYADMAIGLALLINIKLPENFLDPLKSQSITEFWRRWHVTLYIFFKEYVYKPFLRSNILNSLNIETKKSLGMILIFITSGAWHGNGLNFLTWGAMHAIYILIGKFNIIKVQNKIFNRINIFILCYLSFIPFRCINFQDTTTVTKLLLDLESITKISADLNFFFFLCGLVIYKIIFPYSRDYLKKLITFVEKDQKLFHVFYFSTLALLPAIYLLLFYIAAGSQKPFIYFAF